MWQAAMYYSRTHFYESRVQLRVQWTMERVLYSARTLLLCFPVSSWIEALFSFSFPLSLSVTRKKRTTCPAKVLAFVQVQARTKWCALEQSNVAMDIKIWLSNVYQQKNITWLLGYTRPSLQNLILTLALPSLSPGVVLIAHGNGTSVLHEQ